MPQMMALGVQSPNIDALGSFREGVAGAAGMDQAKKAAAEKSLQLIGAASMHALGGNINGQADPQKYEEGLNMLADMGMDVEKFRGKPQLANAAAKASVSTMQQLTLAQNEEQFQYLLEKFERDMMESDRSFGLEQQKEQRLSSGQGYRMLSPEEASGMGLPPGSYQVDGENKISQIGGGGVTVNNQLPAELGARIGLGDAFIEDFANIEQQIESGAVNSLFERGQLAAGAGEPTALWRAIDSGREALVRNLTGAGMSVSEAENQAQRYQISSLDSKATMLDKIRRLKRDLEATREGAIGARTGELSRDPPASGGDNDPLGIR